MRSLCEQGASRLILDLRNNPGGLVTEAVSVAGAFPKNTLVMRTRGRKTEANVAYVTKGGGGFTDWRMTLLVDESTAVGHRTG